MMQHAAMPDASALDQQLAHASPHDVVACALETLGRANLALVSSFGAESAALLKVVADVDPAIPVIFLDTGYLFAETLAYRDDLTRRLGLMDVRTIHPSAEDLARDDAEGDLWHRDPDACCRIRKVEPLARALTPFTGWINGRKRYQAATRAAIPVVEQDGPRLKFNPFAQLNAEDVALIFAASKLPPHPLVAAGFPSVGCMPCTSRVAPGEDSRAGRWRGRDKVECGIHVPGRG